jgi:integrase
VAAHEENQMTVDKWVVRVEGIDTETGKRRPRQLGTYDSRRAALSAARTATIEGRTAERGTVGWLVHRWVEGRTDVSLKARQQYAWAERHIQGGLGAVRLDRLERDDVTRWLLALARGGHLSRRSIQVCRNVLRAALADAVDEGILGRSPASRAPLPRDVAKPDRKRETQAWTREQVMRFLGATDGHRLAAAFRIAVLYGLRRSEVLALRWDDVDVDAATLRIDEGLVPVIGGMVWTNAKNERSRRVIPLDTETVRALLRHRREQAVERLFAGPEWTDHDLVFTTDLGHPLMPRSFDRTLQVLVARAGVPALGSHGLRHTAATHMVQSADDLGELRAVADVLGHSPEILLRIYAHALPDSIRAVADRIGQRARTT